AFGMGTIYNKVVAARITTGPVATLGHRFYVETKYAAAVAAPTTMAPDPTRTHRPENREQTVHPLYANVYVADKFEGLIIVGVATMIDGNPKNNFLERALTFNPGGILTGARTITIVGTYAYIGCDA